VTKFAYNNSMNESTGRTPFFLNRGRHPRRHPEQKLGPQSSQQWAIALEDTARVLKKTKSKMKKRWDQNAQIVEYTVRD
jgi:hypothetical protein